MKKALFTLSVLVVLLLASSCGGSSSRPFAKVADIYKQMGEIIESTRGQMPEPLSPKSEKKEAEEKLIKALKTIEALKVRAKEAGEQSVGKTIPCVLTGLDDNDGLRVGDATITKFVGGNGCRFELEAPLTGDYQGKVAAWLSNGKERLLRINAFIKNGAVLMNFTLGADVKKATAIASATEIEIAVTQEPIAVVEPEPEPESAYIGETEAAEIKGAVMVDGVQIAKGMPLAETLGKLKHVSYEYNADSGIWASTGNVAIVIDEEQLSPAGVEFMKGILSDIAPDIAFKPEYVKADAVILDVQPQ